MFATLEVNKNAGLRCKALVDGQVLCVHGGLSPDLRTLDQVSASHHLYGVLMTDLQL